MLVFCSTVSDAATETSKPSANKTASSTSATTKPTAKGAAVNAFTRAVEAGKEAVKNAMSSRANTGTKGALPAAFPDEKKKYVFEYPEPAAIDETMEPVKRSVTGEVGFVIKAGMNVEFDRQASSSSDLWIEFTKGIKLEGVKSLSEFLPGDKVQVFYEESKDHSKRAVRSVKLLKRKTEEEKKREAEADARAEAAAANKSALSEES